jgi:CHAT domain-containing protein/TPR repeat protein
MANLEEDIANSRQEVESTPESDPNRSALSTTLASLLGRQYEKRGKETDLEEAISVSRQAVKSTPEDHPNYPVALSTFAMMLLHSYNHFGNASDLEEAVKASRQAVKLTPEGHQNRSAALSTLAKLLELRYEQQSGEIADLKEAVDVSKQAVESAPEGHPNYSVALTTLGGILGRRITQVALPTGPADLKEAITTLRQAVKTTPEDHPNYPIASTFLGRLLGFLYYQTGEMADIEESIRHVRQAINSVQEGNIYLYRALNILGVSLSRRYDRLGETADIEEAVMVAKRGVRLAPDTSPNLAAWLVDLSFMLGNRHGRTGSLADLEDAMIEARRVIEVMPKNHIGRPLFLTNLGINLSRRYDRTGQIADLEEAITVIRKAIELTTEEHPNRRVWLDALGRMLGNLYDRTAEMAYIEEAIVVTRKAVDLTPESHYTSAQWTHTLAVMLNRRGKPADIDEAITVVEKAIKPLPKDHFYYPQILTTLTHLFSHRYNETKKAADLENAMTTARKAIGLEIEDHPELERSLNALGTMLRYRYDLKGEKKDEDEALQCFLRAYDILQAPPLPRIQAARAAIQILQKRSKWADAVQVAKDALNLLPLVCGRYSSLDDQQHAIVQTSGLAADVCSIILKGEEGDASEALQQLERGRGLILGYIVDNHIELALKEQYPLLANRYETLRSIASSNIDNYPPPIRQQLLQQRKEAPVQMEECLRNIRQMHGFERFLEVLTVKEMKDLAIEGPIVVVNVTDISADAIIVPQAITDDEFIHIPLPKMMASNAPTRFARVLSNYRDAVDEDPQHSHRKWIAPDAKDDKNRVEFLDYLSWLWSSCVSLVLLRLGDSQTPRRIWWVGTGAASSLPFHAAVIRHGHYDTLVHSYAPTLKMLSHSKSLASEGVGIKDMSVFMAAMPTSKDLKALPGVQKEKKVVKEAMEGHTFYAIDHPSAEHVLEELGKYDVAHFACHGKSDGTNPINSCLVLQKEFGGEICADYLTASMVSKVAMSSKGAWMAYLSACSTAEVRAKAFVDEGLHLAGAFQGAGFRHIVGSLWSAHDNACAEVAGFFYRQLLESRDAEDPNRTVAEALQDAICKIRQRYHPIDWAPFIHLGA